MTVDSIDVVTPVAPWDVDRFTQVCWPSMRRYFEALGTWFVVLADDDFREVGHRFPTDPVLEVLPASTVVTELRLTEQPLFRGVARAVGVLPGRRKPQLAQSGWRRQQLVKLAFAEWSTSPFFLTLDADAFCVRPTTVEDLIVDDRALCAVTDEHPEWYADATPVLGLPPAPRRHSLMPSLLSVDALRRLAGHIADRAARWETAVSRVVDRTGPRIGHVEPWRASLLWRLPWAEYGLYYTFLEATGSFDEFHVVRPGVELAGNSLFAADDLGAWDPALSFRPDNPYFFTIVQSNKGVEAGALGAMLGRWLEP